MSFKLMGQRHHWFSREMTSEEHEPSANNQPRSLLGLYFASREEEKNPGNEVAQKFHTDDATLPSSG